MCLPRYSADCVESTIVAGQYVGAHAAVLWTLDCQAGQVGPKEVSLELGRPEASSERASEASAYSILSYMSSQHGARRRAGWEGTEATVVPQL